MFWLEMSKAKSQMCQSRSRNQRRQLKAKRRRQYIAEPKLRVVPEKRAKMQSNDSMPATQRRCCEGLERWQSHNGQESGVETELKQLYEVDSREIYPS